MITSASPDPLHIPPTVFYGGLSLVMLAFWLSFIPDWLTFIHVWRVELFASVFLLITLSLILYHNGRQTITFPFSIDERRLIVFPLAALIIWSAASTAWAFSWKSAIHHTLVWIEYLIFYTIVRCSVDRPGGYRRMMNVFVATLLIYALPAVAGYFALVVFGGSNTLGIRFARFGEQVITILPLLLVGIVRLEGRKYVIGLLSAAGLWLLIVCSFGRANHILFVLGVAAAGAMIFGVGRYRVYRRKFLTVAAALTIAAAFALSLPLFFSPEEPRSAHRFSDGAALSTSNDFRKLMISLSLEMFAAHPFVGVGADNFGFQVNKYRETYALEQPNDPNLAQSENEIPERAHNEYLQIAAELGTVGIAIFAWFLTGVGVLVYRTFKDFGTRPLHAHAAVAGIVLFLISSLVTSYSFRLIQNGFVFFFVLAVAAKYLFRGAADKQAKRIEVSPRTLRLVVAGGTAACLLLAVYSSVRVGSVIITQKANYTPDINAAFELYRTAMRLDDENPDARYFLGMRLFQENRYTEAVAYLQESIRIGRAGSADFSYLATAQSLAGDLPGAEKTFAEAAVLYPQSPFVLTRYAALLRENGKTADSAAVFVRALAINKRAANTWWTMITEGPRAASERAFRDKDYAEIMDLQPQAAIYAFKAERDIRYPEEKTKFNF